MTGGARLIALIITGRKQGRSSPPMRTATRFRRAWCGPQWLRAAAMLHSFPMAKFILVGSQVASRKPSSTTATKRHLYDAVLTSFQTRSEPGQIHRAPVWRWLSRASFVLAEVNCGCGSSRARIFAV
jgi:hypothetical protein